jgi:hypothetical protein
MAAEPKRIRVGDDMEPILEEATNRSLIFEAGGSAYRINAERIEPTYKIFSDDDPLFDIIGIAQSSGPENDVARDKYSYLDDAYLQQ